ncbi:MAG: hypothetical protein ACHP65_04685 [Legionellales bacterium]
MPLSFNILLRTRGAEALLLEPDYQRFEKRAEAWLQQSEDKEALANWTAFCATLGLDSVSNSEDLRLSSPEKLMLMKVVLQCFANRVSPRQLALLIPLARHLRAEMGQMLYEPLMAANVSLNNRKMESYLKVFQLLLDLSETEDVMKVLKDLPNLPLVLERLETMQAEHLSKKYPKRDLQSVVDSFATVSCPLKKEALDEYQVSCKEINDTLNKKELRAETLPRLKDLFRDWVSQYKENKNPKTKLNILITAIETARRIYKKMPYDTQVIALLALMDHPAALKGRLAQIQTGEGKSIVIALLAAVQAALGNNVDIVTSSDYLAMRDCDFNRPFFEALGLSVSHICDLDVKQEHFQSNIIYGTDANYEFALLGDGTSKDKLYAPREQQVVIVDEVDNMMLDAHGAARIAITNEEDFAWVYEPILKYVSGHLQQTKVTPQHLSELNVYLKQNGGLGKKEFTDARLTRWLVSAQTALYLKIEEEDYVVKKVVDKSTKKEQPLVCIVDHANTGRIKEGSQWQGGIHQFLQAKHGLAISKETLTLGSINHPTFLSGYKKIFGLTGTMGGEVERQEIESIYRVDSFDVPSYNPCQRVSLEPSILADQEEQTKVLLQQIKELHAAGRPVLLLCETIKESKRYAEMLRAAGVTHQLLNAIQGIPEDFIIANAGAPGQVTIATNTAGRGTDIILPPSSIKKGGLHVIFTFFPANLRVESQGAGRAGRQGAPGSWGMVLNVQDQHEMAKIFFAGLKETLARDSGNEATLKAMKALPDMLYGLREDKNRQASAGRLHATKIEVLYYQELKQFYAKYQHLCRELETKQFKDKLSSLCCDGPDLAALEVVDMSTEAWIPVLQNALIFVGQHQKGHAVDSAALIEQFTAAYLEHVKQQWAVFFSQLPSSNNNQQIESIASHLSTSYAQTNLEALLVQPLETSAKYLKCLMVTVTDLLEQAKASNTKMAAPRFFNGSTKDANAQPSAQELPVSQPAKNTAILNR